MGLDVTIRRRRCRIGVGRGQSVTEFALVTPILLLVLFGIIQFGAVMVAKSALTFAVREGARIASIHGAEADADSQVCAAIVRALGSSGANPSYLGAVVIYRANESDFASGAPRNDNPSAHDVGTCSGGTWAYTDPWDTRNSSYRPYQRSIIVPTDRIGVAVTYSFHFILPMFGNTLTWQDADILQMEPQYAQGTSGVTAPTAAPTYTQVPYPTATCQPTQVPYPTFTATATPSPTPTPTGTLTPTPTATSTSTPTATAIPTNTPIVSPTATPTITPGGC